MFTRSVYLIGMTASGKTTIGKVLADELGFPFYDADHVLEEKAGVSVSWIFEEAGEAEFRRRESLVIDELSQMRNIVLATGGGAVLRPRNRERLRERGLVVYLSVPISNLLERVKKDASRPLLRNKDTEQVLVEMQRIRDPLYVNTADTTIETNDFENPPQVAKHIANWYHAIAQR